MKSTGWTGSDAALARVFEDGTLPDDAFGHVEHVRLAWWYVRRYGVPEAITRFGDALRRLVSERGHASRYHETITWAYLLLVHERVRRAPALDGWASFARANPDLLDYENGPLNRYYKPATLDSTFARRVFVLPDAALPHSDGSDGA